MNQEIEVVTPAIKPSRVKRDKKTAKVEKAGKVAKAEMPTKKVGIGKMITEKILAGGMTNDEILKFVKETCPTSKTTYACVAWYKSKLRKAGEIE